jgi:heme/copper-type cytochrome/quinol oxidase subunit 3
MSEPRTLDVSALPPGAFGSRALTYWGTLGIVLIESTAFALGIGAYFYLATRIPSWPPDGVSPPDLRWGTINTVLLLASMVPNEIVRRAAEQVNIQRVRIWMFVCLAFAVAFVVIRIFEYRHLNVWWNRGAYASITWMVLSLHSAHIVTDLLDSSVLAGLLFIGPVEERRFVDVEENAVYWYFVVLAWLPIYGVIYWAPRLM